VSQSYSIGDLAKEFGVTVRTLRHYEQEGLLSPERRGQMRCYSPRDRARLSLILRGRRLGFTLAEIVEILDLYGQGEGHITQLLHAKRKFADRLATLERQKMDIDESLAELKLGLTMIENKLAENAARERPQQRVRLTGYGVMPMEDEETGT
jgi:DNA-binding transcriptional MerR regulator